MKIAVGQSHFNTCLSAGVLLALFGMWGCRSDKPWSKIIGPKGGEIVTAEGVRLEVPPGALTQSVKISVEAFPSADAMPPGSASLALDISTAVELKPDGLELLLPAKLTIPLSAAVVPHSEALLFQWLSDEEAWLATEFPARATSDGSAYEAEISHFSILGPGSGGTFNAGGARPGSNDYFYQFKKYYCYGSISPGTTLVGGGCCLVVGWYNLRMIWNSGTQTFDRSDTCGDPGEPGALYKAEQIQWRTADGLGMLYATVYILYDDPRYTNFTSDRPAVYLDDDPVTTVRIGHTCRGEQAGGEPSTFRIEVDGEGRVQPAEVRIGPDGKGTAQYDARGVEEEGEVTLTATLLGCKNSKGGTIEKKLTIRLGEKEWYGTLTLTVNQPWDDATLFTSFSDTMTIELFFNFDVAGTVTGSGGGSHSARFGPGDECSLAGLNAPGFDITLAGTLDAEGVSLGLYSDNLVVTGTFTCPEDDYSYSIPMGMLINAILAQHVKLNFPLEVGATDSGSGSEDFGDDKPMTYSYTFELKERSL